MNGDAQNAPLDGGQMALLATRFDAIARNMAATLLRTGRSGVLNRAKDLSCCIVSADHELVCAADSLPIHVLSGPDLMARSLMGMHPDARPGDAFLNNSPYHGCSHAADHTILVPVFDDGGRHGFTLLVKAHQADIGNSIPTTYFAAARNVYEEGALIFPNVQVARGRAPIADFVRMCELRIRAPEQWRGDFEAMLGAAWSGERDLLQLAREFGWDVLRAFVAQWLDYGEKRTRRIIAALPAGKGRATVFHDPMPGTPAEGVPVTATVTIDPEAGEIEVDLRDNLDCLPNGLNLTEATARTAGLIGIFNSIPGNPPKNAGTFRPLRVLLRDGCTVGVPTHPASCSSATTNLADRVAAATQIAIAGIAPDLGMAEVGAANAPAKGVISGLDPRSGRYVVNQLFLGSTGGGAHPRGDGWLTNSHAGNAGMSLVDSIELVELCHPLVIRERAIVPDSEGAGRTIGAPAMRVVMEVAVGEIELVYASDCSVHPARGVCGGADAHAAGQQCVRRGKPPELLSNIGRLRLEAGDAIISIAAGGGGYGNPRERPAHLVARDVAAGLISAERARDVYGVPRNAANQEV